MTTKTKSAKTGSEDGASAGGGTDDLADRLSDLMVSVRTTQGTGAFTPEQEAEWMAIDAVLRGTDSTASATTAAEPATK